MNDTTAIRPAVAAELGASAEEFQNLHEFVRKARINLNQNAWDYIVGAAETETTLRRNRMALDEIAFRPRVLRDVSKVDASVEIFSRKLRLPVLLAPVGALETFDPGSAATVVRAADRFGVAHMLSSVTEPGLEKVAEAAPTAMRMYQLYVRGDDAFVEDHVSRAIASGYTAFCLTADTAHYSRRERDIAKRYVRASRVRAGGGEFQMGLQWRTVKLIKEKYNIPLIIKGIATAEDAESHSIMALSGSMCPITAVANSTMAAGPCRFCPRSSPPSPAAPGSWSTARSAAAPISSRRSPRAPISSASDVCNAGRSPLLAKPGSCGCSRSWKTK
jgi:FMN-dependent dehydrogenase